MAHRVVVGLAGKTIKCDPDPVIVCHDCEVHWEPGGGVNSFRIEFPKNGSPFDNEIFDQTNPKSGPCRKKPGPLNKQSFKYTLTVNGVSVDPSVIVDGGP